MTGIAALAMCAGFVSCSHDDDLYDADAVNNLIVANYNQAFVKAFGQVAPNQEWGFGSVSTTRGLDVNGNLWKEIPGATPEEKLMVYNYVNMTKAEMTAAGHKYYTALPKNLTDYWVTHIWTGTDTYSTIDETSTGIVGSGKMNHLVIAKNAEGTIVNGDLVGDAEDETSAWFHVNNFNRGDNTDWSGNTAVYDAGTYDFAYLGSDDSNYHNTWIAVKGEEIDRSLAGKYYICFSFVEFPDNCQTNIRWCVKKDFPNEPNRIEYEEFTTKLPGAITAATANGMTFTYNGKEYTIDLSEDAVREDNQQPLWKIEGIESGNQAIEGNGIYTDWIVRIVEAEEEPAPGEGIRVFAEDLSANDATDFDFNDVVFDAEYVNETQAKITVWCAGGILPLRINSKDGVGGFEVHEVLGKTISDSCMINTHAKNVAKDPYTWQDNLPKYVTTITIPEGKFEKDNFPKGVRDLIRVEVKKYIKATNTYKWFELTAKKGEPACKIAGPLSPNLGIKWLLERKPIGSGYPKFADYVNNGYPVNWWSENVNDAVLYGIGGFSTTCRICHE